MERHNEVLILKASGVGLGRSLRPIFIGAAATAIAALLIQNVVLPGNGPRILNNLRTLKAPERRNNLRAESRLRDDQSRLFYFTWYNLEQKSMLDVTITVQRHDERTQSTYRCEKAAWEDGAEGSGGWRLQKGQRLDNLFGARTEHPLPPEGEFLPSSLRPEDIEVSVADLWEFLPYRELRTRAQHQPDDPAPRLQMHVRILSPLYTATLFFLGLPFGLLGRQQGFLFTGFFCVLLCGSFYGTTYFVQGMARLGMIPPGIAAWIPILVFLPIAIAFLRSVRT